MKNPFEARPETYPNQLFPCGDIDLRIAAHGMDIIDGLNSESPEEKRHSLRFIRSRDFSEWLDRPGQLEVFNSVRDANKSIRENSGEFEADVAMIGFQNTVGLIQRAGLLTLSITNFSDEIIRIGNYDHEERQDFTDAAWCGMYHSHPNLHSIFAAYSNLLEDTYDLKGEEQRKLLDSGIVLPYLLVNATRIQRDIDTLTVPSVC